MSIMPRDAGAPERWAALRAAALTPAVHMLIAGGCLMALVRMLPATPPAPADPERLLRLAATGIAADDPAVEARLLKLARHLDLGRGAADTDSDRIEAARTAGLVESDVVIRRYMTELVQLALERPGVADRPTEAELRDFHERNVGHFTAAGRVRATQVYLRASRSPREDTARALALLDRLRVGGVSPAEAASYGDPFVRGPRIDGTQESITRAFGPGFAQAVEALLPGKWQGPLASAHGLHLVWVEERLPPRLAPLDTVRGQVVHGLLRERGLARAGQRLAALDRATRDPSFARSRSGGPR